MPLSRRAEQQRHRLSILAAISGARRPPGARRDAQTCATYGFGKVVTDTEPDVRRATQASMTPWVRPAESARATTSTTVGSTGSWLNAIVRRGIWSAAVFDPALPGRSTPTVLHRCRRERRAADGTHTRAYRQRAAPALSGWRS